MLLEPRPVVVPERRAGHEQEAVVGAAQDRQVGLDPTALVQQLRVDDGSDPAVDPVRTERLEERERARPEYLELREARLV